MHMKDNNNSYLIITGPTGVGKTDLIDSLALEYPLEIINGDVGQLYSPLSIGTAKPDLSKITVPHHLFDLISEPLDFSVVEYRDKIVQLIGEIHKRGNFPVIVGGSGFYLLSLFFPPQLESSKDFHEQEDATWQMLYNLDPERAEAIHHNDTYRIVRALQLIKAGNNNLIKHKPSYNSWLHNGAIIFLNRNREELYERINSRVFTMLDDGWIEEVQSLSSSWKEFLNRKKLIGYDIILHYLDDVITYDEMVKLIQQKTRNYAKRQITFWKMFAKKLENEKELIPSLDEYELDRKNTEVIKKNLKALLKNFIIK